jgi:TPP-dependent pyruvate/acetoin dehydrogenase alpha subunit
VNREADDVEQTARLIEFEADVAKEFEAGKITGPVHLSGGNEKPLIDIFKEVGREDWVFSTYRNHYHALLHGLHPEWLRAEIRAGRSMYIRSHKPKFFSSAIVGGCLPIAVGVAKAMKLDRGRGSMVWCFLGDMAATSGAFNEALWYAEGQDLPIKFVIEDNQLSCDTPTQEVWGRVHALPLELMSSDRVIRYRYERVWPHVGTGKFVQFAGF